MRQNRGNLLLTVLCVMAVLCTLALALHWQQARARSVYMRQEAEIQARMAAEYQVTKTNVPTSALDKPDLDVGVGESSTPAYDPNVATQLYSLPDILKSGDVSWDKSFQSDPGNRWYQLKPTSLRPELNLYGRRMLAVVSTTNPYAVFAPNGKVKVESVAGWANPTFPETLGKAPEQQFSAVPAWLGAKAGVEADDVPYGEVFSLDGPFLIKKGAVVAHRGYLPSSFRDGQSYTKTLEQQLTGAMSTLSARAQNKTNLVSTGPPGIGDVWDLITGSKSFDEMLGGTLSLRQGLELPLPMIPGGNENGIVTNIWLHVPFPPDALINQNKEELQKIGDQVEQLNKKIEELKKKITDLEENIIPELKKQLAAAIVGSPAAISLGAQLADAVKELDDARQAFQDAKDLIDSAYNKVQGIVDAAIATGSPNNDGPATRDDEAGLGNEGQEGWAYTPVFSKILSIFGDLITLKFEKLGEDTMQKVRLIHFGPHDNKTELSVTGSEWNMTATLNVPPGRSLRYDGNVTIRGDLWIQKGGSLIVGGNLTMVNPLGAPTNDVLDPQGKICLEEGATLIVTGTLTGAGAPRTGSMLVSSPVNVVHPVTVGVLVGGDVSLPFGIFPAVTLTDLSAIAPGLVPLSNVLSTIGANLSKVDGPFHRRKPYFAKYATTFQIVKIPPPFPAIIPLAIPLPTPKNIMNPIFNSLSMVFSAQLNLVLGENYMTYTDWWFFGKGVVPMVPKIDPASMVGLQGLTVPTMPGPDQIANAIKDYAVKATKEMVTDLITKVVTKLVGDQLGFGLSLVSDFLSSAVDELANWVTKADGAEGLGGSPAPIDLSALKSSIENRLNNPEPTPMLAECGGALVYSGNSLTVGGDPVQKSPLAVGFLVARNNVNCQTDTLVGAAMSFEGDVTVRKLLYVPEFTRASLYLVKNGPTSFLEWAIQPTYGSDWDSNQAVSVGPAVPHLSSDSWDR